MYHFNESWFTRGLTMYSVDPSFPASEDVADELAEFRDEFHLPRQPNGEPCVYLCGNSLGLQPKTMTRELESELRRWRELGFRAYFDKEYPWLSLDESLTGPMARIVGAQPDEIALMGSATSNLHALMASFYRPTAQRYRILIEDGAFPSDRYVLQSHIRLHGFDPNSALLRTTARHGETTIRPEDIESTLCRYGDQLALVFLGGVNFYTGQAFDIERIAWLARERGVTVGADLSHAVGISCLRLHDWNVDFAVWCNYKYLNADPGGIATLFVHDRHGQTGIRPTLTGWWGHSGRAKFPMPEDFEPSPGAAGWKLSGPSILQLAILRAALDIVDRAGIEAICRKQHKLTTYCISLMDTLLPGECKLITPRSLSERGSQLSFFMERNGSELIGRLAERGVLCDWKQPNVLRIALAPLYNSLMDVWTFASTLRELLTGRTSNQL